MAFRAPQRFLFRPSLLPRTATRLYASASSPPPLLKTLKSDLKTAMRARDAARLSVLRSLLSSVTNASKTASPINTDAQLVQLMRKNVRASEEALAEFRDAGREDLVEKEQAQIQVLEEYCSSSGVRELSEQEVKTIVKVAVDAMTNEGPASQVRMGDVMKKLLAPGGPLEGTAVDKAVVAKVVKEAME